MNIGQKIGQTQEVDMPGEVSRSYSGPKGASVPTWMEDQRTTMDFLSWLLEDTNQVEAEANTPRDDRLKQFVQDGHLTFRFCAHGTNTYAITDKWFRGVR